MTHPQTTLSSPSTPTYQSPLIKRKQRQQRITHKPNFNPYIMKGNAHSTSSNTLSSTSSMQPSRIPLSQSPYHLQERSRLEDMSLKMYSSFTKTGQFDEMRLMGGYGREYRSLWERRMHAGAHVNRRESHEGNAARQNARHLTQEAYSENDSDSASSSQPAPATARRPQSARHGGMQRAVAPPTPPTPHRAQSGASTQSPPRTTQYSPRRQTPQSSFFPTEVKVSSRLEYSLLERSGEVSLQYHNGGSGGGSSSPGTSTPLRHMLHSSQQQHDRNSPSLPPAHVSQRKRPFSASVVIGSAHKRASMQQQLGTPRRRPMSASASKGRDSGTPSGSASGRRSSVVRTMGFSRGATPRGGTPRLEVG